MNRKLFQCSTLHTQRWKVNMTTQRQFSYGSTRNVQKLITQNNSLTELSVLKNLAAQLEVKRFTSDFGSNSENKSAAEFSKEFKKLNESIQQKVVPASSKNSRSDDLKKLTNIVQAKKETSTNGNGKFTVVAKESKWGGFWKWFTRKQTFKKPLSPREIIHRDNDPFKRFEEDIERERRRSAEKEKEKESKK